MQMDVVEKKPEMLLSRTMVRANVDFDKSTPSYKEMGSLIASHLKTDEKLVAIRHIYTAFGRKKAEVIAYIYSDEEKKQSIEPKLKEKKDKKAKGAKK